VSFIAGGTPGDTERTRGALLVGTEVVKLRGGGVGMGRCWTTGEARLTQKWMVVLGRRGSRLSPRTDKDHPAFQRARRRDSDSGRDKDLMNTTSSLDNNFFSTVLLYRIAPVSFRPGVQRILYGKDDLVNLLVKMTLGAELEVRCVRVKMRLFRHFLYTLGGYPGGAG